MTLGRTGRWVERQPGLPSRILPDNCRHGEEFIAQIAQIAPTETAIGRPTATARRLVDASVSATTRRAYAGAVGQLDAWLAG